MAWQRNASGAFTLTNVNGRVCLDALPETTATFGIWVVICDVVGDPTRREFSVITTTLTKEIAFPDIKYSRSSNMSFGAPISLVFDAVRESNSLNLYCTSQEEVNYSIFRFWSNQSYTNPTLTEGAYGSTQTTPQIVIDCYGRMIDIKDVTITPDWSNVLNKPTTVALSGLIDALSTSSVIDCGNF